MKRQMTFFDGARLTLDEAIDQSLDALRHYGKQYRHWAVAYSGGKDSTATVTFVAWAIRKRLVPTPNSLTVLYVDTRMELPPLQESAQRLMRELHYDGHETVTVLPEIDDRFLVYVLGLGVPPSSNTFRWCTPKIKIKPMQQALRNLRLLTHEKVLMLTGVRIGESAARDQRIAVSCSRDAGECGQGWFQVSPGDAVADTLAPLLHWRLCHVYDWLYFDPMNHRYPVQGVADVYGEDEVRTGCMGCPLASRDVALERIVKQAKWAHLEPLLGLKPLWRELKLPTWRKRKVEPEVLQDGSYGKNAQRMGPLTMEGRAYGLERVLCLQEQAHVDLINAHEESRIREMWQMNMWPQKWSGKDADADEWVAPVSIVDGDVVEQALMFEGKL